MPGIEHRVQFGALVPGPFPVPVDFVPSRRRLGCMTPRLPPGARPVSARPAGQNRTGSGVAVPEGYGRAAPSKLSAYQAVFIEIFCTEYPLVGASMMYPPPT